MTMPGRLTEKLKTAVAPLFYNLVFPSCEKYRCPICGYYGGFKNKVIRKNPRLLRIDSKCLKCRSTERHRMMYLVLEEVAKTENLKNKKVLHIAPEACLKSQLTNLFERVDTADLFMKNVDFKEDLQRLTFPDESYDWIVISRVLTVPPDLEACLDELRRVVRPGGGVVVAETYTRDEILEYGEMKKSRSRVIGLTLLDKLEVRFTRVDRYTADRYRDEYQLINRMVESGAPRDNYPESVKCPGLGFKELIAICRV